MVRRLEHVMCEESVRELGLLSLENGLRESDSGLPLPWGSAEKALLRHAQ